MSHRFVDGLAWGPYLPSVSSLRETHSARIDTIQKFKHDNNNGLVAAFRWREIVPDILLSSMAVHCNSYSVGGNLTHVSLLTML